MTCSIWLRNYMVITNRTITVYAFIPGRCFSWDCCIYPQFLPASSMNLMIIYIFVNYFVSSFIYSVYLFIYLFIYFLLFLQILNIYMYTVKTFP